MSIPWCSAPAWYLETQQESCRWWLAGATATGGTAPFGEAVAAEPGQDHDVDVLHVGPHAQVLRQLREGVGLGELVGRCHRLGPRVLVVSFVHGWGGGEEWHANELYRRRFLTCICPLAKSSRSWAPRSWEQRVRCVRLSSCLAGELSPLVHRPPNSASPCTHPRRRSKAPDPKEQVKEWKKQMRGEERKLDRQIMSELRARLPPRRAAA